MGDPHAGSAGDHERHPAVLVDGGKGDVGREVVDDVDGEGAVERDGLAEESVEHCGGEEHDGVDAGELLEELEAGAQEGAVDHVVVLPEEVEPGALPLRALLLDLGLDLVQLGPHLVVEAQLGEDPLRGLVLALGRQPPGGLRHHKQHHEEQRRAEEDVAAVGDAPALVPAGEGDVEDPGEDDPDGHCELPHRRELSAEMLGGALADVHGHDGADNADGDAAEEPPGVHHVHVDGACLHRGGGREEQGGGVDGGAAPDGVGDGAGRDGPDQRAEREEGVDPSLLPEDVGGVLRRDGPRPVEVLAEAPHHKGASAAANVVSEEEASEGRHHRDEVHERAQLDLAMGLFGLVIADDGRCLHLHGVS